MFRTTAIFALALAGMAHAHGDVTPQAVDTSALPEVGEDWLTENPYRVEAAGEEVWMKAIEIGASGYNQNCARCHGLGAVSGGLAPDLRYLEAEEYGDEWYVERFREGVTQNGTTKMPAFGELLGQEAAWAIRTYVETRADGDMVDDNGEPLGQIRDELVRWADDPNAVGDVDAVKQQLDDIAANIETLSGAPVADSVAWRASQQLDGTQAGIKTASETLTVGLSSAQ
ncbi:Quinohemoprotein alcohol dehydrogenase ADH-IIG precursor [Rhodobacteraceae bacterium THAF1]|uniref:cytochrome c-550 PedF n=1 Tax=Palleronia sp. THAF1 TaxID=2587842 RepID=UPI000F3B4AEE|nr:cytochrome c-550 PedF [Palleronia sp. THAF1]QFU09112.1 Quinohemoprotein alcohol dehydrogenase ADH-IIG precursor [Palleronia sp. THAF1]VDC24080.1 Quinohemoprotein alcohol dehydrogenase ADH-IIG precursor [Rhodobacteraceae bacterium THAF1]